MTDNNAQSAVPLKTVLTQRIEQEQLQPEQLQQLMQMQQSVLQATDSQHNQPTARPVNTGRRVWLAACVVAVISALLVWRQQLPSTPDYSREIAYEVIKNHLKLKPLDVQTQSIDDVKQFFTQLDFAPVNSDYASANFALPETAMLGARYCSVRGITAAQLRYRQADSGISTLYEVAYDAESFGVMPAIDRGETPTRLVVNGLQVSMWVEKGLLMVLVSDIQ